MLTSTCSPVIHQSESMSAVALSPGLSLIRGLVVVL